jgi:transcription termination/antitermination protein NusG
VVADLELPLFSCYLFAKVAMRDRLRLLQLPGVIGFAVTSAHPTSLPEEEIRGLRDLSTLCHAEPHPFLSEGDRVRLIAGPLSGMEGVLLRKKTELRVVLSLDIIMRSVSVEVSEFDIEPVSRRKTHVS